MDDEHLTTRFTHRPDKVAHEFVAFNAVNTDAVLDGHWNVDHVAHGLDAIGHGARLVHEAGAKSPSLDPIGRTATVEVDLVITPLLAQPGG